MAVEIDAPAADGGFSIRSSTEACDHLLEVQPSTQVVGEFLEWCNSQGLRLCEVDDASWSEARWVPTYRSVNNLLADFVGLDLDRLETERRRILDRLRQAQAR